VGGPLVAQSTPAPISVMPIAITSLADRRVARRCERPARAAKLSNMASHAIPLWSAL
jgi:hypothetical protein